MNAGVSEQVYEETITKCQDGGGGERKETREINREGDWVWNNRAWGVGGGEENNNQKRAVR